MDATGTTPGRHARCPRLQDGLLRADLRFAGARPGPVAPSLAATTSRLRFAKA